MSPGQANPPSVGLACAGFGAAVLLGGATEFLLVVSFLSPRPLTVGDVLGFVIFQWAPLLLWLGVGLRALAWARPSYRKAHG